MSALVDPAAVWAPAVEVRINGAGLAADVSASLTEVSVTLESDAIDRGFDGAVDEFDDEHQEHRCDQHGTLETIAP